MGHVGGLQPDGRRAALLPSLLLSLLVLLLMLVLLWWGQSALGVACQQHWNVGRLLPRPRARASALNSACCATGCSLGVGGPAALEQPEPSHPVRSPAAQHLQTFQNGQINVDAGPELRMLRNPQLSLRLMQLMTRLQCSRKCCHHQHHTMHIVIECQRLSDKPLTSARLSKILTLQREIRVMGAYLYLLLQAPLWAGMRLTQVSTEVLAGGT